MGCGKALEIMRQKTSLAIALGCVFLTAAFVAPSPVTAHDDDETATSDIRDNSNPNLKKLTYEYAIDSGSNPFYEEILKAMQPSFKGTSADMSASGYVKPSLNIAQADLNGDDIAEVIAVPIENTEDGNYCGGDYTRCPHYILDVSSEKIKVLGVIKAFAIDVGDEVKDGFWTLKAFKDSRLPDYNPEIQLYRFSKKQNSYVELRP